MLTNLLLWAVAHPIESGALFASAIAVARGVYLIVVRLLAPYPRARAAVEAFAALGPDLVRFFVQLARALTGLALPVPGLDSPHAASAEAELARLRLELASMTAHRDRLMGALADRAEAEAGARETIVPEPSALRASTIVTGSVPPPASGQAGHASLASLVMILMVVGGVALAGFLAMGCHPPSDCQAGRDSVRCSPAGVPQRCDTGGRWRSWATRPCSAVGRECLAANGHATCVVTDGGVR